MDPGSRVKGDHGDLCLAGPGACAGERGACGGGNAEALIIVKQDKNGIIDCKIIKWLFKLIDGYI